MATGSFDMAALLIKFGKHTPDVTDVDHRFYKLPVKGKFVVNRADGKVYIGDGHRWNLYTPISKILVVESAPKIYV